jgi:hypothetical protein
MLSEEKPALNEDLLVHFGVKGMRWGVKKVANRSSGGETIRGLLKSRVSKEIKDRLRPKTGMSMATKAGIGLAVVGGSAAVGYLLAKRGDIVVKSPAVQYRKHQESGREAHSDVMESLGDTRVSQITN